MARGFGRHRNRDAKKDKHGVQVKNALGGGWRAVEINIGKLVARNVAAMCDKLDGSRLIDTHFHSDTLQACQVGFRHAKGGFSPWYSIPESKIEFRVHDWEGLSLLPPREDCVRPATPELTAWVTSVNEIRENWARVKFMADWLDNHATLGAIRYYWPSMLLLAPDHAVLHQVSADKFRDSTGISAYLPLLRETATTVAAMKLLPEATDGAAPASFMTLKLKPHTIQYRRLNGVRTVPLPGGFDEIEVPEFRVNL